ncbi:hypothetical protein C0Q70_21690 [Pomacea canaliculata]|uniref:Uncharacterized protein n=1 Tax=Pomacea canaliculata TaxID=400727 RepID=A0A2T7ND82_POMCA|nr:hypothetical protein C0Q70_21690 [Pomacea canaliculata]
MQGRHKANFFSILNVAAQAMPDPCLDGNYKNLTDVHRSVSYVTTYPEPPLCDIDLVAGWYRATLFGKWEMIKLTMLACRMFQIALHECYLHGSALKAICLQQSSGVDVEYQ